MSDNILGRRTVIYHTSNLKEAKKWYADAFEKPPYFDEDFYVGFEIGGYELGLLPAEEENQKSDNVETYWGVNNIEDEYQRFLDIGAKEHTEIKDVGDGILVCTVLDPWNNVIGLIHNPHFKLS